MTDTVDHPTHYNAHPSGVECITVTEHMNFNLGNAVKYIWRAGLKAEDPITDLRKAAWYVQREIARLEASALNSTIEGQPVEAAFGDICKAMQDLLAMTEAKAANFAEAS